MRLHRIALAVAVTLLITQGTAKVMAGVTPQGTAITYQGLLKDASNPANGLYDLNFALFDSDVGGAQIGASDFLNDVIVSDGLFTVVLDYGDIPWSTGQARWLQISVRPGASMDPMTPLAPRQPLTAAPYSLSTRGIVVDVNERVGIGTNAPVRTLDVRTVSGSPTIGATTTNSSGALGTALVLTNDDPAALVATTFDMFGDSATARISLREDTSALTFSVPNGAEKMRLASPGLGIGTTTPSARLHVMGAASGGLALNVSDALLVNGITGFVGIGRDDALNSNEVFGLYRNTAGFAGMYVETELGGEPFYGYSDDGSASAYHYYDGDDNSWRLNVGTIDRFIINSVGSIGIGTTAPTFLLHVNGSAGKPGGGSWAVASDARLKKNIQSLHDSLDRLLSLRGVTFEYIDPESIHEPAGTRIGMIAQDVEPVFPDWVNEKPDGMKTLTFSGFEALTVEALRELRAEKDAEIAQLRSESNAEMIRLRAEKDSQIDAQQATIEQLLRRVEALERQSSR